MARLQSGDVHLRLPEWQSMEEMAGGGGALRAATTHVEQHHYLRVHMGNLRQKLEADPAQPRHLLTETGVGYRLVA